MPWILNAVNNPVFARLGSAEMMSAENCYLTEAEAKEAQRKKCLHKTLLGNSATGQVSCADCGATRGLP